MEASQGPPAQADPFQQGIEIGDDDPFAGADGDFEFADESTLGAEPEAADVPIDTADLPVVDKEGQPVAAEPAFDPVSQTLAEPVAASPQAEAAASAPPPAEASPPPPPAVESTPAPEPVAAAPTAPESPPVAQPAAEAPAPPAEVPPVAAQEPPAAPEAPAPVAADPPETETAAPAPADIPPAEPDSSVLPDDSSSEEDESALPEEKKDKSGRVTHRRYRVLHAVGPHKFEDAVWWESKDGTVVEKGTTGAKRQSYVLGRDQDHARKLAFVALGTPQGGLKLVVVADSAFQPKHIELAPPKPEQVRLKVS